MMVLPVDNDDVTGTTRLGCCGVLLAVGAACRSCKVPVDATFWNGKMKLSASAVLAVLAICKHSQQISD